MKKQLIGFLLFFAMLASVITVEAQQIIIDKPVKAGELTLFPEMGNENVYYFLPDQLRLAADENGKPQFSFLKYVENVRSASGAEDNREGSGGGIVHAVVSLAVSPDQLVEAKAELRKINADATIQGPVIYSGGTMTIVSSFTNTEGDLSKQVVGIGKAPLIDGQKAAISLDLTKKGAKILWESFKTSNPDISFSFEMELSGYRAPVKANIEADFEKVYSHHGFQLGAVGSYGKMMFGGEIELAFDDLRNDGAIKVVNMGSDAEMDKLIEVAYNKLTSLMFDPMGKGNPLVSDIIKGITNRKSPMDRANDLYKQGGKNKPASKSKKPAKKTALYGNYSYDLMAFNNHPKSGPFDASKMLFTLADNWEAPDYLDFFKQYCDTYTNLSSDEIKAAKDGISEGSNVDFKALRKKNMAEAAKKGTPLDYWYDMKLILNDTEYAEVSVLLKKDTINIYELTRKYTEPRLKLVMNKMTFLTSREVLYCEAAATFGVAFAIDFMYGYYQLHKPFLPTNSIAGDKNDSGMLDLNTPIVDNVLGDAENKDPDLTKVNPLTYKEIEGPEVKVEKDPDGKVKDAPSLKEGLIEEKQRIEEKKTDPDFEKALNKLFKKEDPTKKITDTKPTSDNKGDKDKKPTGKTSPTKKEDGKKKVAEKKDAKKDSKKKEDKEKKEFRMAAMASYQMKSVKQKGKFSISLNKYTSDKLVLRFDENIGAINCDECFHEVNLDDPMFKQREIVAMLDGFNFNDFGKYINYVNLRMKKHHQNGEITIDEVRIDRDNFAKVANNFKLLYGWKGDNDRDKWLDYEIQSEWSFFGGCDTIGQWETSKGNIVNLAAPYLRRTIELESNPAILKDQKVRSISVKIYYKMGDKERVEQVTLMPSREQFSRKVDIMLPNGSSEYEYEINWRLFGNITKKTDRLKSSESILFVDEL